MLVRQSGSHIILRNQEGKRHDPIGKGLPMEIIAETGMTKNLFSCYSPIAIKSKTVNQYDR